MAAGAVSRMVSIQYALIYLPFVGLGLLAAEGQSPSVLLLSYLDLTNSTVFAVLTILTFLGAAINYQVNLAIYGPEGPRSNPKHSFTASYHRLASYFISNPKPAPRTLNEFSQRVGNSLKQIKGSWFLYVYLPTRFFVFAICGLVYLVVEYSLLIGLSFRLFDMTISSVGFVVLFGFAIKKIQSKVAGRIQSPVGKEPGEWFMIPESRKAEHLYQEDELEPRYAPEGWSFSSFFEQSIPDLDDEGQTKDEDHIFVPLPGNRGETNEDEYKNSE